MDELTDLLSNDEPEPEPVNQPTDLIKDNVLGSSGRDNQQDAFLAYMQGQGLQFDEYAAESAAANVGEDDGNEEAAANDLGLDLKKFKQKNPAEAELDEKSKQLEGVTTDNIKKIRNPRNQARQIDRTIDRTGDKVCDEVSKSIQAILKGEMTPGQFAKTMGGVGKNAAESLMKDGLGASDLKDLGKKAALAGAAMIADRAGLDDQLQGLLSKIKNNKKKMRDIGNTKKAQDKVLDGIFKKLPPVVRQILKGDKNALQRFIDQECTQARREMKNDAMGRAGLTGKVRDFVDKK